MSDSRGDSVITTVDELFGSDAGAAGDVTHGNELGVEAGEATGAGSLGTGAGAVGAGAAGTWAGARATGAGVVVGGSWLADGAIAASMTGPGAFEGDGGAVSGVSIHGNGDPAGAGAVTGVGLSAEGAAGALKSISGPAGFAG